MSVNNDCFGVELHTHLDGSIPANVIYNAAKRRDIALPPNVKTANDLKEYISCVDMCNNLEEFLEKFYFFLPIIAGDKTAINELCLEYCKLQYNNKVYYTETRFCPQLLSDDNITTEQVLQIVLNGLQLGCEKYGIKMNVILCLMRHWKGDEQITLSDETIKLALKYKNYGTVNVCGIDFAGSEKASTSKDGWGKIFKNIHDKGIYITIHAGEQGSYNNIYDAIENLYADRVGHGYAAIQNIDCMKLLKKNKIHVECCPISSWKLNSFKYVNSKYNNGKRILNEFHPIVALNENGVSLSINSDDPVVLDCSYLQDIAMVENKLKVSKETIASMIIDGAKNSFIHDNDKKEALIIEVQKRVYKHYLGLNLAGISDDNDVKTNDDEIEIYKNNYNKRKVAVENEQKIKDNMETAVGIGAVVVGVILSALMYKKYKK
mmetsp:Transcript_27144/g.33108  ORF Transcript_27144/g.33108 Transcript_27144/m.33108 type:complete len:434 (+) Transcript_27144:20-1321(+)